MADDQITVSNDEDNYQLTSDETEENG